MSKKNRRKRHLTAAATLIKGFAIIVSFFFLSFTILFIATSRFGLKKLTLSYIANQNIPEDYYEAYQKRGFSKDQYEELLNGTEVRDLTAQVLSERLMGIFHYDSQYRFNQNTCSERIKEAIKKLSDKYGIILSDKDINSLSSYTMDICGISTMLLYDTPAAYRTALFDANSDDFKAIDSTLSVISKLDNILYPIVLCIMHIICIVYLCIVYKQDYNDLKYHVCSTMILPALFILAFSAGELFCIKTTSVTGIFLAKIGFFAGMVGIMIGILETILVGVIFKDKKIDVD